MFFKKKISSDAAVEYLYSRFYDPLVAIEDLFQELSLEKDTWVILSDRIINRVIYEYFFVLVYHLQYSNVYVKPEEMSLLFEELSSLIKNREELSVENYIKRVNKIDEAMKFAYSNASNLGGIGAAILTHCFMNVPEKCLLDVKINKTHEMREFLLGLLGFDVFEQDNKTILTTAFSSLSGILFGELTNKFMKDVSKYFKEHRIV